MPLPPIREVRVYKVDGEHGIAVLYGDTWAILRTDQKSTLLDRGVVMLQPSRIWGERLEPVKVPKDGEDIGFDMTIHNAVVDHRLARLILEFRDGA